MKKRRSPSRKSPSPSRKGSSRAGRGIVEFGPSKSKPRFKPKKFPFGSGPLPKKSARIIAKARRYSGAKKGAYTKKINRKFRDELQRSKRYTAPEIEAAEQYRLTGKVRRLASLKYYKEGNRYRIGGRFVRREKYMKSIRMRQYHAVLRSYREKFGLSQAEARQLYRDLRDERYGDTAFGALY